MSDNYSALDTSQYGDSTATSDYFTKTSDVLHDSCDMDSTAESHEVTSKRRPVKLSNMTRFVYQSYPVQSALLWSASSLQHCQPQINLPRCTEVALH